jgi:hypothetical protein
MTHRAQVVGAFRDQAAVRRSCIAGHQLQFHETVRRELLVT